MQDSIPENDEWGIPHSLEKKPLTIWPQNILPTTLEDFVRELARSTETPVELSVMLALAVVATTSQTKYQVQIKEGYIEPINLWTIGILPPASRKSSVYREATAPLRDWEKEQKKIAEPIVKASESHLKTMEARIKGLRIQASKAPNDHAYNELQEQIEKLEGNLPKVQKYPQIWASDVTNEQLAVLMANNDDAMALLSDEGGIFDIISGLYSDGRSNIDLFLQAHAGGSVRVDRGSRPPIFMERAVLTMGLTVQPITIKNICGNKSYRGRGMLGRFLYVMPKSNIGTRNLEELPMPPECMDNFYAVIRTILSHDPNEIDGKRGLHTLQLNKEAYTKWLEYAKCNETLMSDEMGYLSHITDWAGKLPGAIARIAGLLHIVRHAHGCPWEHLITIQDMSAAVKIGHALTSHALAVFDLLQEDDAMNVARSIYQWIKEQKLEIFSRRDCSRKFRRYKKTELIAGLVQLEEAEIVRKLNITHSAGRPKDLYQVNPKTFEAL